MSWSHICELITIDDDLERQFYENECIKEKWDVRTLRREKDELLVSKYELYLPNKDELKHLVDRIIEEDIQQG